MKKRIISLILVFLMVFSLSIPVAAAQGTTQSGTCTDSQTLLLSNVDNFCEEFDIQQELPAMYSDEDVYLLGTTDYTYVIKFAQDGIHGQAKVSFSMDFADQSIPITVDGNVRLFEINDHYSSIRGFLKGMVTIDGKSYTVDVGLNKLDNLDTISAGVTLTPSDFNENENARPIYMSFGTSVMTDEFLPAYQAFIQKQMDESDGDKANQPQSSPRATLAELDEADGYYRPSGVFTGEQTGSTVTISRDSSNDRFILFLQSYTENIAEDEFPTSQLVAPRGIASFRIGLKRVGIDTSISSIEGVSEILDNQNSGGGSMSLDLAYAVLLDFLTVRYGIPTNFLSRIFEGSEGEPYVVDSGENSYLDVTVDTLGINFDSRNSRMPVGFNIQTNGNVGRYQGYAEISYYVETQFALLVVNTTRATTGTVTIS